MVFLSARILKVFVEVHPMLLTIISCLFQGARFLEVQVHEKIFAKPLANGSKSCLLELLPFVADIAVVGVALHSVIVVHRVRHFFILRLLKISY